MTDEERLEAAYKRRREAENIYAACVAVKMAADRALSAANEACRVALLEIEQQRNAGLTWQPVTEPSSEEVIVPQHGNFLIRPLRGSEGWYELLLDGSRTGSQGTKEALKGLVREMIRVSP